MVYLSEKEKVLYMLKKLSSYHIEQLKDQGCKAEDWDSVFIHSLTDLKLIENVTFSGKVSIGVINGFKKCFGGVLRDNVIKNVHLHNVEIGDNVFISGVKKYIANYKIGNDVFIENVNIIAVDKHTRFGNGTMVEVINEGGGREIPIFNKLTAQIAYLLALYRDKKVLVSNLLDMVAQEVASVSSDTGMIGNNVTIENSNEIKNVCIGDNASISGVAKLVNGSINSTNDSPVKIGVGVMATNFIISSDSVVDNATILSNSFVGQGCVLDKHYSVEHSVFFANSQGYNGEACSLFAGPYTVTHHKSTLLIAGMFSFMNAGSGSNQSNHMYKLGPIHQGIMERGAKTTSDSYVLWPSKIGAFTLVMGRHYNNVDSSDFPFSYLLENNNKTYLVPGVNLRSVGTVRDAQKWPKRDKRNTNNRLDIINFNLLSPFTLHNVYKGYEILKNLLDISGENVEEYSYKGMIIKKSSLLNGIHLYETVIKKFLGNSIISRITKNNVNSEESLNYTLGDVSNIGRGKWVDIGGFICPENSLNTFMRAVETREINEISEVNKALWAIHNNYYEYEWDWAESLCQKFYGFKMNKATVQEIIKVIKDWKEAVVGLDKMLYKDASKEFSLNTTVGFGVDGEENEKKEDFKNVRGSFEENSTVVAITEHIKNKSALADSIIEKLQNFKKENLCVE